ncbi:MAG: hypothetical protein M3Y64_11230, partial [Gemmatimonadota bacterium]|nr:hypothetical protein [Gemmatimonadota bacterium]
AFNGLILAIIVGLISVTACITVVQRMLYVYRTTLGPDGKSLPIVAVAGTGAPSVQPSSASPLSNASDASTEVPARS